jgi:hypothetical protein
MTEAAWCLVYEKPQRLRIIAFAKYSDAALAPNAF